MPDTDPAVLAVADAMHSADNCSVHANDYGKPGRECEYCVETAELVVEAAQPWIERRIEAVVVDRISRILRKDAADAKILAAQLMGRVHLG